MATIKMAVDKQTMETTVSVECVKGSSCVEMTADLEMKVAGIVSEENRTLTEEFNEQENVIVGD